MGHSEKDEEILDKKKEVKCPVCGSKEEKILLKECVDYEYGFEGTFDLVKCTGCSIARLKPLPTIEQLIWAYPLNYHGFTYGEKKSPIYDFLSNIRIRGKAKIYKKLIGPEGKVLDVGCADGFFIGQLKHYGKWDLWGLDFKKEAVEKGRKKGFNIVEGTFESITFENSFFNLLLMNHILEHVQNPLADLQKARRVLKPGGYIVGEVPNIKSFDYHLFKRYWGGLHVPRHTFQYSPESFSALVEKSDLEVVSLGYEMNTTHWALSVQNYIEGSRVAAGKGSRLNFGRAWYYSFLLLAFIPINALSKLYQRTGVISFVLRKRAE